MARNGAWWGTAPLVVGVCGLVLLAFGAKWLPGGADVNAGAREKAEEIEKGLRSRNPEVRNEAVTEAAEILAKAGNRPDADALEEQEVKERDFDFAAHVRDKVYNALSDRRDSGPMIAGRIAFYAGLVLVFAAGVMLYRRTPESNRGAW